MRTSAVLTTALILIATGTPLTAQEITGRISDDIGQPVAAVTLELLSAAGRQVAHTASDSSGRFVLPLPSGGTYRIRATRIGYTTVETDSFEAAAEGRIVVSLTLRQSVLEMTPVLVETTRRPGVPPEFARRRAWAEQDGRGVFLTHQAPLEYGGAMAPCAAVVLWSRSADDERRPFNWVRVAIGGAGILGLLLLVAAR